MKILKLTLLASLFISMSFTLNKHIPEVKEENSITNLFDAFGKKDGLIKEFGFSCLIQYNGTTILFDAGSKYKFVKSDQQFKYYLYVINKEFYSISPLRIPAKIYS